MSVQPQAKKATPPKRVAEKQMLSSRELAMAQSYGIVLEEPAKKKRLPRSERDAANGGSSDELDNV